MSSDTNGVSASRYTFIYQLNETELNSKVRFLCSVCDYDEAKGELLVKHDYPRPTDQCTLAKVDINIVLESVNRDMIRPGSWVNVIGYVTAHGRGSTKKRTLKDDDVPHVQAVLLWDAGVVQVEEYERVIADFQAIAQF